MVLPVILGGWQSAGGVEADCDTSCAAQLLCLIWLQVIMCVAGVQVDGPWHFAQNTRRPVGQTSLKRRLLVRALQHGMAACGVQMRALHFHVLLNIARAVFCCLLVQEGCRSMISVPVQPQTMAVI